MLKPTWVEFAQRLIQRKAGSVREQDAYAAGVIHMLNELERRTPKASERNTRVEVLRHRILASPGPVTGIAQAALEELCTLAREVQEPKA